jgi:hypothetical protein
MKFRHKLAIGGLLAGTTFLLSEKLYQDTIGSAMCRGVSCLSSYAVSQSPGVYAIDHSCIFIGSPTGIGIFNNRRFGKIARDILGTEYIFFDHEFIFIVSERYNSRPIIVINRNPYLINDRSDKICGDKIELIINVDKTIQISDYHAFAAATKIAALSKG